MTNIITRTILSVIPAPASCFQVCSRWAGTQSCRNWCHRWIHREKGKLFVLLTAETFDFDLKSMKELHALYVRCIYPRTICIQFLRVVFEITTLKFDPFCAKRQLEANRCDVTCTVHTDQCFFSLSNLCSLFFKIGMY